MIAAALPLDALPLGGPGPTTYLALFGAGVASFLAPCVVPLVPVYLTMIAGTGRDRAGDAMRGVVAFVVGFAAVFATLGAFAGVLGSALVEVQDWTRRVSGILLILLGVLLIGLLRTRLSRQWRPVQPLLRGGVWLRGLVLGIGFGAAWTPCVGPLLAAALIVASGTSTAAAGAALLAAYAVGIAVPFVVVSLLVTFGGRTWPGVARRLGPLTSALQRVSGAALVVLGVLLVADRYSWLAGISGRFLPSTWSV